MSKLLLLHSYTLPVDEKPPELSKKHAFAGGMKLTTRAREEPLWYRRCFKRGARGTIERRRRRVTLASEIAASTFSVTGLAEKNLPRKLVTFVSAQPTLPFPLSSPPPLLCLVSFAFLNKPDQKIIPGFSHSLCEAIAILFLFLLFITLPSKRFLERNYWTFFWLDRSQLTIKPRKELFYDDAGVVESVLSARRWTSCYCLLQKKNDIYEKKKKRRGKRSGEARQKPQRRRKERKRSLRA